MSVLLLAEITCGIFFRCPSVLGRHKDRQRFSVNAHPGIPAEPVPSWIAMESHIQGKTLAEPVPEPSPHFHVRDTYQRKKAHFSKYYKPDVKMKKEKNKPKSGKKIPSGDFLFFFF